MRAACSLPRISTCTLEAAALGTRASAMERFMVGENVPLVTSPVRGAAESTRRHARGHGHYDFLMTAQHAAFFENQPDELDRRRRRAGPRAPGAR